METWTIGMLPNSQNGMLECGSVRDSWPKVQFACRKRSGSASEKEVFVATYFQDCKLQNPLLLPHQVVTGLVELLYLCLLVMYLKDSHNLVQGRAVAALIADRTSQYYIVSVYLHPDRVRQDLAALCQALQGLACPDSRIILAGDFNRADERCAGAWDSFLEDLHVYDVFSFSRYLATSTGNYPHLIVVWWGQFCQMEPLLECY